MAFLARKRNRFLLVVSLIGLLVSLLGFRITTKVNAQTVFYNAGLIAYDLGDMRDAVKFMDLSLSTYLHGEPSRLDRWLLPGPDRLLAAKADFQKGKALAKMQQPTAAVDAFQASLKLNPGNLSTIVASSAVLKPESLALDVKYNLELLYKSDPSLAKKQGSGAQSGSGNSGQPVPGTGGRQPGKGNSNDI